MTTAKNTFTVLLLAVVAATSLMPVLAMEPSTASAPAKADGRKVRGAAEVIADLQAASGEVRDAMGSPRSLMDEAKRKEIAPASIPALKKMIGLMDELAEAQPEVAGQVKGQRFQMEAMLVLLGDADTVKGIDARTKSEVKDEALTAKLAKNLSAWWGATKDAKAQEVVLVEMAALAKEWPKSDDITGTLLMMKNMGAATPKVGDQAEAIVTNMSGQLATNIKTQKAAEAKKNEAVGKPIELAGKMVDGKDFSTKEYKGKVVLVDFWATWCGPCRAELPHVKEIYKKYHEKGLEIVGISCDSDGEKLASFTKKQEMPWVQLWDKDKQTSDETQWHELAKTWGVDGIPTMFLIDRNGVLRTMEARENMEEMIPKLLEEKAGEVKATIIVKPGDAKDVKVEVKSAE